MTFDLYLMVNLMKRVALQVHSHISLHGTMVNSLNTIRILPDTYPSLSLSLGLVGLIYSILMF